MNDQRKQRARKSTERKMQRQSRPFAMTDGGAEVEEEIWQEIGRRRERETEAPTGRDGWRRIDPEKEEAEKESEGLADEAPE